MTPEGKLKKSVKAYLISIGVWVPGQPQPKNMTGWMYMPSAGPFGAAGIPDFCGIYRRKPFYIETKGPDGSLRPSQIDRAQEITAAGGVVVSVWSLEELIATIESWED